MWQHCAMGEPSCGCASRRHQESVETPIWRSISNGGGYQRHISTGSAEHDIVLIFVKPPMSHLLDHRRSIIHHGRSQVSSVQGKLVKDSRVVEKSRFLTVARIYTAAGKTCLIPRILNNFCTGVDSERLLSLLRFILQPPKGSTFTNRLRMFSLFFSTEVVTIRKTTNQGQCASKRLGCPKLSAITTGFSGRTYRMTVTRNMHVVSLPTFIRPCRIII